MINETNQTGEQVAAVLSTPKGKKYIGKQPLLKRILTTIFGRK